MPRPTRPNDDDPEDLDDRLLDDLDDPHEDAPDDLTDEAPDGDDLDLGEEWTEESPVEDFGPEPTDLPGVPIEEVFVDEETDEWDLLEQDKTVPVAPPPEQVALPWTTRAAIPALQLDLPAVLDPTRPHSEWRVATAPDRETMEVLLRVGPVEARATLHVVQGEPTGLVLGRDVLAGRILVRSDPDR